ncbi:MAG: efflux RND transporter permease subunit, partial [Halanaerobium sp.]|nr:efflux RND transporter permease subunit [Halanaerobium sp.]
IKKYRRPLLVIFLLINIIALIGIFQVRIEPGFDVFMPAESEHKTLLEQMEEEYPASQQLIFLLETEADELTVDAMASFREVQSYLEGITEIATVQGPAPRELRLGFNSINIDNIAEDDLTRIISYYQKMGGLSPLKMEGDYVYGIFTIFPGNNFTSNNLHEIESYLQDSGFKYYASGDMYLQQKIFDYIWRILLMVPPLALLLILLVFRLQMGTMKATILSVLPAGIGALWTMGLIGWIGQEVSVITVLAPIFTIVIGSADGLHFISHVQDARHEGSEKVQSIIETLHMVGIPMIITTVTSMAGFLSLLVMNTAAIKDLAIFASTGILLAGFVTWYVLPLILSGGLRLDKPDMSGGIFSNQIRRLQGKSTLVILTVILLISIFGINRITTEFNQLMIYKEGTSVQQSFKKLMEVNNGGIPVYVNIKTEGDPLDSSYAKEVFAWEDELVQTEAVGKAISVYDFFATMSAIFSNQSARAYPENMLQINMMYNMQQNQENNPARQFINREEKAARIMVFPVDLQNNTLDIISEKVAELDERSTGLTAKVTGVQYLMRDLNSGMMANQARTLFLAFSLVFILLLLSLRSIKPALISLLPIGMTVIFLFGFLGLSGISLNLFTATIFSITIGVGIDYAIHYTSVWMSFTRKGLSKEEAAERAFNYTSRPILANAFGLAIGLSALLLSPLQIHLYVSVLMWAAMVSSVFFSLSFLPTILTGSGKGQDKKSNG